MTAVSLDRGSSPDPNFTSDSPVVSIVADVLDDFARRAVRAVRETY